jgi:polyphosphate kinase
MLVRAAEAGKQVVCLIELKARFDEQRNILWAQELENAGVHVVYGVMGLKTHCKTLMVVRKEENEVVSYVHIGTGNYHKDTANFYTDLGLFTARPEITGEIVELFHFLTGRSLKKSYETILVAPFTMKDRFVKMIDEEIKFAGAGKPAQIICKFNSLEDVEISRALYRASQAGVKVTLLVRGFCCLRPGVPGMSDNINVISIIGRFLEHSRIFYFRGGDTDPLLGQFFIGSADWMYRNLHARVEVVAPIGEVSAKKRIWELLNVYISDQRQAWDMNSDGTYVQRVPDSLNAQGSHAQLMHLATESIIKNE